MFKIEDGNIFKVEVITTKKQESAIRSYYGKQYLETYELADNSIELTVKEFSLETAAYKAINAISYEIEVLNQIVNVDLTDGKGIVLLDGIEDVVLNGLSFYKLNGTWRQGDRLELAQAIELKRNEINAACRVEIEAGFEFEGKPYTYCIDPDQLNVVKVNSMFLRDPGRIQPWRAANDTTTFMDKAMFDRFVAAIEAHESALLAKCWSLKDQLVNCTTVEEVEAIVWTNGV